MCDGRLSRPARPRAGDEEQDPAARPRGQATGFHSRTGRPHIGTLAHVGRWGGLSGVPFDRKGLGGGLEHMTAAVVVVVGGRRTPGVY